MSSSSTVETLAPARVGIMPLLLAALLGFVIIGVVGFAHMDVVHNAGHDYRHSMAFPCH